MPCEKYSLNLYCATFFIILYIVTVTDIVFTVNRKTQVLGRVLPHAETCDKRRSGPACLPRASEPLPGLPRKKGQWLEVSAEESEVL